MDLLFAGLSMNPIDHKKVNTCFMDDALKTWDIKGSNVEPQLLFTLTTC